MHRPTVRTGPDPVVCIDICRGSSSASTSKRRRFCTLFLGRGTGRSGSTLSARALCLFFSPPGLCRYQVALVTSFPLVPHLLHLQHHPETIPGSDWGGGIRLDRRIRSSGGSEDSDEGGLRQIRSIFAVKYYNDVRTYFRVYRSNVELAVNSTFNLVRIRPGSIKAAQARTPCVRLIKSALLHSGPRPADRFFTGNDR